MSNNENLGCLGFLLKMIGLGPSQTQEPAEPPIDTTSPDVFPYRIRDDFLSPAELSFQGVLRTAIGERAVICPKVGLGEIFYVPRPNENRSAKNKISQKHVDFVICDLATMKLLVCVELDDSSHARPDRQDRDAFVDKVFQAANLPLIHIPAQRGYNVAELKAQLESYLAPSSSPTESVQDGMPTEAAEITQGPQIEQTPICPKCGVPMVARTVSQGARAGTRFYGCTNYPRCRNIVNIDASG